MQKIKCPKCGEIFTIDEAGYAEIVKQVRDSEFSNELAERLHQMDREHKQTLEIAKVNADKQLSEALAAKDKQLSESLAAKDKSISDEIAAKDRRIIELSSTLENKTKTGEMDKQLALKNLEAEYQAKLSAKSAELRAKEEEIEFYKNFKARQSTKMIGEDLERFCENEFNKIRATAFPNAYFEKDNDASQGTKGDFIYREQDPDGVEILSIMFEMKNEADETATKHKNEDFLKKLNDDRIKKNCEYAVLVSMLEPDNDLYNDGIVDKSYRFPKMYVIRPQFFIPLITILRNTSMNALEAKRELAVIRNQNIDITNFEDELMEFKAAAGRNYELAGKHFKDAIDNIDKTIKTLNKIKESLEKSVNNIRIARDKADDLTIKKLTRGNPTMTRLFAEADASRYLVTERDAAQPAVSGSDSAEESEIH